MTIDRRRIVVWKQDDIELMGRFGKFMALHDNYGNITAHALVEMGDGQIAILDLDVIDFRFVKEADDASQK